jgi:RNA ligase (TIGR02306 family)
MRKLATVRKIREILPINGADNIELALVDGWEVVVGKGIYGKDELVVYLEIDSWVPTAVAPFLTKPGKEPSVYNGIPGERLRTIKLKKQVSQGLIPFHAPCGSNVGDDLSESLNITKWERPEEFLPSNAKGNFPAFIPKTEQERLQNIELSDLVRETEWEVTEKMHGSSMTVYHKDGVVGVCSRNFDLLDDGSGNFWKTAHALDLPIVLAEIHAEFGLDMALQGELCGPGINGNQYLLSSHQFYVFDIFDITHGKYLLPEERQDVIDDWLGEMTHVPVIYSNEVLGFEVTNKDLLKMADGESQIEEGVIREGLVFKSTTTDFSFKAVSNNWLYKTGE